jgi:hypothetical protein
MNFSTQYSLVIATAKTEKTSKVQQFGCGKKSMVFYKREDFPPLSSHNKPQSTCTEKKKKTGMEPQAERILSTAHHTAYQVVRQNY